MMGLFVITLKSLGNSLFGAIITEAVKKKRLLVDLPILDSFETGFNLREKSTTD